MLPARPEMANFQSGAGARSALLSAPSWFQAFSSRRCNHESMIVPAIKKPEAMMLLMAIPQNKFSNHFCLFTSTHMPVTRQGRFMDGFCPVDALLGASSDTALLGSSCADDALLLAVLGSS